MHRTSHVPIVWMIVPDIFDQGVGHILHPMLLKALRNDKRKLQLLLTRSNLLETAAAAATLIDQCIDLCNTRQL